MTIDKSKLSRWLRDRALEHLQETHSDMKPTILRRAAKKVGLHILGNWVTAWDPVHINGFKVAMAVEAGTRECLGPMIDLAAEQLFHGHVIPVQKVLAVIEDSTEVSLGRCVCRASGITSDLVKEGEVYMVADDAVIEAHLEQLLGAFESLRGRDTITSPRFVGAFERARATKGSARQRLGLLFEEMYPYWEILLKHKDFTILWRDNMHAHDKALPIHLELLKPLVLAHYHVRGALFTGMEVVNERYCICTCPGPENDQGCSLVNWHYFSRLDHALFPNTDEYFGQRMGPDGSPLPCERFEARASRPCLGCGCDHSRVKQG